ncbi:MAG TPA: hypothetical protein VJG66_00775 [Patescibacteria group bacterium]|nr:hypothetical protein [Patescibacteria group bacterium]
MDREKGFLRGLVFAAALSANLLRPGVSAAQEMPAVELPTPAVSTPSAATVDRRRNRKSASDDMLGIALAAGALLLISSSGISRRMD